jgi:hypothetical protein
VSEGLWLCYGHVASTVQCDIIATAVDKFATMACAMQCHVTHAVKPHERRTKGLYRAYHVSYTEHGSTQRVTVPERDHCCLAVVAAAHALV